MSGKPWDELSVTHEREGLVLRMVFGDRVDGPHPLPPVKGVETVGALLQRAEEYALTLCGGSRN